MTTARKLGLIAAGYVGAFACGYVAVAVDEAFMPDEISQGSPGMVAFGDMILFVLVVGIIAILPTVFLLKLLLETAPRVLLAIELVIAVLGPVSWLAVINMATAGPQGQSQSGGALLGLFIAFLAIPRMVGGPVVIVIEAVTFWLMRGRIPRALLACAMLMDLVPLSLFALHMWRATHH